MFGGVRDGGGGGNGDGKKMKKQVRGSGQGVKLNRLNFPDCYG